MFLELRFQSFVGDRSCCIPMWQWLHAAWRDGQSKHDCLLRSSQQYSVVHVTALEGVHTKSVLDLSGGVNACMIPSGEFMSSFRVVCLLTPTLRPMHQILLNSSPSQRFVECKDTRLLLWTSGSLCCFCLPDVFLCGCVSHTIDVHVPCLSQIFVRSHGHFRSGEESAASELHSEQIFFCPPTHTWVMN